jgi:hypothetical protein
LLHKGNGHFLFLLQVEGEFELRFMVRRIAGELSESEHP